MASTKVVVVRAQAHTADQAEAHLTDAAVQGQSKAAYCSPSS